MELRGDDTAPINRPFAERAKERPAWNVGGKEEERAERRNFRRKKERPRGGRISKARGSFATQAGRFEVDGRGDSWREAERTGEPGRRISVACVFGFTCHVSTPSLGGQCLPEFHPFSKRQITTAFVQRLPVTHCLSPARASGFCKFSRFRFIYSRVSTALPRPPSSSLVLPFLRFAAISAECNRCFLARSKFAPWRADRIWRLRVAS